MWIYNLFTTIWYTLVPNKHYPDNLDGLYIRQALNEME